MKAATRMIVPVPRESTLVSEFLEDPLKIMNPWPNCASRPILCCLWTNEVVVWVGRVRAMASITALRTLVMESRASCSEMGVHVRTQKVLAKLAQRF